LGDSPKVPAGRRNRLRRRDRLRHSCRPRHSRDDFHKAFAVQLKLTHHLKSGPVEME